MLIYQVKRLLGHRDIKKNQIYAKLIDKKKDQAIDKFPSL
jgi:site-specific recombinase XerD